MYPSSRLTLAEEGQFWYHLVLELINNSSNDGLHRISVHHREIIVHQRSGGQIPDEVLPLKNAELLVLHLQLKEA